MQSISRRICAATAAFAIGLGLTLGAALAESSSALFNQVKLSEQQVRGYITAQKDLTVIQKDLQKLSAAELQKVVPDDKPGPELKAKLEDIAKRNGFASYEELDDVAASIALVMAGLDPKTGAYTDPVDAIKKEIEDVKKDAAMPDKTKSQLLEELADALKTTPALKFAENVTVVTKLRKEIEISQQ